VASSKSYQITISNNLTEKEAIDFVMSQDQCLCNPTKEARKELLKIFGLPDRFLRAFDLISVPQRNNHSNVLSFSSIDDITFIELKTTQKALPNNPRGFFFGATENEFELANRLGNQYKFCFVSLHKDTKSFVYQSLEELEAIITNKRIQYQINLKR